MEDTSAVAGSYRDQSQVLSDAEKLRQKRRQKILANQGSRMDKILGSSNSSLKASIQKDMSEDENILSDRSDEIFEETEVNGITLIRKRKTVESPKNKETFQSSSAGTSINKVVGGGAAKNEKLSTILSAPEPEQKVRNVSRTTPALGFNNIQEDGSSIHPKLPYWFCRMCLCLLGVALSMYSERYLLVTFFSWESAVLGLNGLPEGDAPSNILVILLSLFGLKEPYLYWIKFVLKLFNCVITDLSLFVVFVLLTRVII